mmetsp:Transcript_17005/g.52199  ORF Transcript_17005/g.52199 Transcript_17005/m.52199 type:complete len:619 (-) Transcript_17005:449-2305(-)
MTLVPLVVVAAALALCARAPLLLRRLLAAQHDVDDDVEEQAVADDDGAVLPVVVVLEAKVLEQGLAGGPDERVVLVVLVHLVEQHRAEDVGVQRDVVAPDEVRRDVVEHEQHALAEHEEAEHAGADGDADDVVGHGHRDERHHGLARAEPEEEDEEELAEALHPGERDERGGAQQRDEEDARQRRDGVGGHVRAHAVPAVVLLAEEHRAILDEEGQHGDAHEDEEARRVPQQVHAGLDVLVLVAVADADEHEAQHEAEHRVHHEAHVIDARVARVVLQVAPAEHEELVEHAVARGLRAGAERVDAVGAALVHGGELPGPGLVRVGAGIGQHDLRHHTLDALRVLVADAPAEVVVDQVDVVVRGVRVLRHGAPDGVEVLDGLVHAAEVGAAAAREQQALVEELPELRRRLVDGHGHGVAHAAEHVQLSHDAHGAHSVEARGGLVEQDHGRLADDLHRHAQAPLLPAAEALAEEVADDDVGGVHEAAAAHDDLDARLPLRARERRGQREERAVHERLAHGEDAHERVLLGHVAHVAAAGLDAELGAVREHAARLRAECRAPREDVQQRRLAGAAGAHDGHHLPRLDDARDVVDERLRRRRAALPAALLLLHVDDEAEVVP